MWWNPSCRADDTTRGLFANHDPRRSPRESDQLQQFGSGSLRLGAPIAGDVR